MVDMGAVRDDERLVFERDKASQKGIEDMLHFIAPSNEEVETVIVIGHWNGRGSQRGEAGAAPVRRFKRHAARHRTLIQVNESNTTKSCPACKKEMKHRMGMVQRTKRARVLHQAPDQGVQPETRPRRVRTRPRGCLQPAQAASEVQAQGDSLQQRLRRVPRVRRPGTSVLARLRRRAKHRSMLSLHNLQLGPAPRRPACPPGPQQRRTRRGVKRLRQAA